MLRFALHRVTLSLLSLTLLAGGLAAQSADELFDEAITAFRRGDNVVAVQKLKEVLATNPGHEDAFRMWQQIDQSVALEMLVERGDLGALTGRVMALARRGRLAVVSDPGGAEEVVERYLTGDFEKSREALFELRSTYGEWSVPALVGPLGDRDRVDNRPLAIKALLQLGDAVVPALIAVLQSDDVLTRSNAATVLGLLRDPRAAPALAWMVQSDASDTARDSAAAALGKMEDDLSAMGLPTHDATQLTLETVEQLLSGGTAMSRPYASGSVAWSWNDGELQGRSILSGLYSLSIAESALRSALAAGAGDSVRVHLAAVHAAQKSEITEASRVPGLEGNDLLESAREGLTALDLNLALAGQHRAGALRLLIGHNQISSARTLLGVMSRSGPEVAAIRQALRNHDDSVATAAALTLGSLGLAGAPAVARIGAALGHVPDRLVMSLGDTGLMGDAAGWQLLGARDVASGLLRAKAFPPKDVIVLQDGLQGVTLDTLIFGILNDPRTENVPVIVVTNNVAGVEALYGDRLAAVTEAASWEAVMAAAGDASVAQQRAMETARHAAMILMRMPASLSQSAAQGAAAALDSGADDMTKAVVLDLAGNVGLMSCLPAAEQIVLSGGSDELVVAAMNACARLWAMGGATGSTDELSAALTEALGSGNAARAQAAAEALGQLGGTVPVVASL